MAVPIFPIRSDPPVVVLTDASFEPGAWSGGLGIVVYSPLTREYHYSDSVIPPWILDVFWLLEEKQTYICQAELLAAACAYLTFPDLVFGRLVHHFVDNQPAESGLIKGASSRPDSAFILLEHHIQLVSLQCDPWVGFVYSEDNLSDPPSRGDFRLMRSLGARRRQMVFPRLHGFYVDPRS